MFKKKIFSIILVLVLIASPLLMAVHAYASEYSSSDTITQNVTTVSYSFWKLNETIAPPDPLINFGLLYTLPYVDVAHQYSYLLFDEAKLSFRDEANTTAYSFANNVWADDKYRYIYIINAPYESNGKLMSWLKENAILICQSKNTEKPYSINDLYGTTWKFNSTFVPPDNIIDVTCVHVTDAYPNGWTENQITSFVSNNGIHKWYVTGNGSKGYLYYKEEYATTGYFKVRWIRFIEHCTDVNLIDWLTNNASLTGWFIEPPEIPAYVPPEEGGVQPVKPEVPSPIDPGTAEAETALDYSDLITDIKTVDGVSNVTFEIPLEYLMYQVVIDNNLAEFGQGNSITYESRDYALQTVKFYFDKRGRLDASCLPSSTSFTANILTSTSHGTDTPTFRFTVRSWPDEKEIAACNAPAELSAVQSLTASNVSISSNTEEIDFVFAYEGWIALDDGTGTEHPSVQRTVTLESLSMTMTVDSLFMEQQQSQKTNALLDAVENKLAENGKKLDDVLTQQSQTNEKLDGIQDSLDNQMQNEIDKAESMGSNASDQVEEAIPDKGAELLPAMQNLAASLSYQGTEAKLPFPKVAMPAIPGVCASFELIPAQDIDFGSYIQMIPETLITIIRALCDIAIVLWAFKELYGIYQYVISLKGGGLDV